MNGSSPTQVSVYSGLRRSNILALLGLVSELSYRSRAYVRHRYEELATDFDTTLALLIDVGLVRQAGEGLRLGQQLSAFPQELALLSPMVLTSATRHDVFGPPLYGYIRQFRVDDAGHIVYRPIREYATEDVAVRDFLMDFEVVTFNRSEGEYVLGPRFSHLFVEAQRRDNALQPDTLERLLEEQEDIGASAERAILDYEKRRVGEKYSDQVKHVAAEDVSAGYDIESVTVDESGMLPRYIEVKAVSPTTYRFFWTANEIAMSRELRTLYFLYLVPLGSGGQLQMSHLRIIRDPVNHVFSIDGDWKVGPTTFCCELSHSARNQ